MGLLDDAIREHLELKRQRGADAEELARQEHEALGPVRREAPAAEELPDLDASTALQPAAAEPYDDEEDEADLDEPEFDLDEDDHVVRGPGGSIPVHAAADPGATEEWGFEDADEEDDEDEEDEPAGEDVLEQTPEFLSETPEHDRLWFEQKPPRDFDFDG